MPSVLAKMLTHRAATNQDRRTPLALFREIDKEFSFKLDPCTSSSNPGNLGTPYFFKSPEQDGLAEAWHPYGSVFVNPPFRDAKKWIAKAAEEAKLGATVVVLLPSKTETAWWHDYALQADEIRFVRGRVTFEDHNDPFIIGIALIVFRPKESSHVR